MNPGALPVTPSQPAVSYAQPHLSEERCEHGINVFHCQVCGPKDHDDDVFVFDRSRYL